MSNGPFGCVRSQAMDSDHDGSDDDVILHGLTLSGDSIWAVSKTSIFGQMRAGKIIVLCTITDPEFIFLKSIRLPNHVFTSSSMVTEAMYSAAL